ncbi:hypothetical protein [Sporocytophaga myxococcoides]|uniref:hypothetical protein n=1 Tax=Sporocytophaga myxococcoides TaxID=153721 RepID=UPI00048DAC6C|nr:hypothetical protein [Sporocytophaga myxococcoides]
MIASYQEHLFKDFSAWFNILSELATNTKETSSLPKLEVSLHSGNRFFGNVIGYQSSDQGGTLFLLEQADVYSKSNVHIVRCSEIIAISLIEPKTYLDIFINQPVFVSELELKRKTKLVEDELLQIVSRSLPITLLLSSMTEQNRSHVLQMVEALPTIFKNLCKDEMGKNAIALNISNIEIQAAKTNQTTLENKQLTLALAKIANLSGEREKELLLHSIEKLL